MKNAPFVWLGTGRAARRGVAPAGALLDRAARGGLPVPNGGIVLDLFYQAATERGLLRDGRPAHPDALHDLLYQTARFPRLERPLVVQAVGAAEGQRDVAPADLAAALARAWSAPAPGDRRDVLVMEQIEAGHRGGALAAADGGADRVEFQVEGKTAVRSLALPRWRGWFWQRQRPYRPVGGWVAAGELAFPHRLQKLLKGVRRTLGDDGWRIAWADDGKVCWLVGVRPLA